LDGSNGSTVILGIDTGINDSTARKFNDSTVQELECLVVTVGVNGFNGLSSTWRHLYRLVHWNCCLEIVCEKMLVIRLLRLGYRD